MTDELIELEMAHLALDKQLRDSDKEEYKDPEFEKWDKETDDDDEKSSYEYEIPNGAGGQNPASEEPGDNGDDNEGEWEDV